MACWNRRRLEVRRVRNYTVIGDRINSLGKRQRHLAKVLGVSQQTVSKKLRGETAILLSDFEKWAKHYGVPMTFFFTTEPLDPLASAACEMILKADKPVAKELLSIIAAKRDSLLDQLLAIAKTIMNDA
jgi:transcriptional regulator with XRE-family HTH domain